MIHLCTQIDLPYSLFSESLATALTRTGFTAQFHPIGRRWIIHSGQVLPGRRFGHSLLAFLNLRLGSGRLFSAIRPRDVVLSYEMFGLVSRWGDGWFHRNVKKRGAKLVCMIQDAWPVLDFSLHRSACDIRAELADLIAGVTPNLVSLLQNRYPRKNVVLLEEAIDTEGFHPDFKNNEPIIVWSAPLSKIREVQSLIPVLESVYRIAPFRLRLVSGNKFPPIKTMIPIEWIPFRERTEGNAFRGATIAFAQYADNEYARCKGNYKVKTYLAAGCAIVTNPVGYNLELIQPGINGLFASTEDEWHASFVQLLKNPGQRLSMRKASRELAVRRFSYHAIAKQYAGVLQRLGVESVALRR